MVSIFSFLPDYTTEQTEAPTAPHVAIGVASPLWLMFGGAAAAGATYWWWANRWRDAVNLEALMALAHEPVAPPVEAVAVLDASPEPILQAVTEPVVEAVALVALVAETAETVLDAAQEIAETVAEPIVGAVVAANEDVAEAVVEPVVAAQSVVTDAVETVAPILADGVDDLTKLVGVGPKLAASLADLGVTKFSQIAAWTPDELSSFDQLLNLKGRAEREAWIAQAQRFSTTTEA